MPHERVLNIHRTDVLVLRGRLRAVASRFGGVIALLMSLVFPTGVALADEQSERRASFIRLYSGVGVTRDSDLRIRQHPLGTDLTFERVPWEHRSLTTRWTRDSVPYVGVRAGFFLRDADWLGLSVEAIHFKILAETEKSVRVAGTHLGVAVDRVAPINQFVEVYRVTNGVNLFLANIQLHRGMVRTARFPAGRVEAYGGAGAGVTIPYTSSVLAGTRVGQYEWGRLAQQLMGGVSWYFTPNWDISFEYKFTTTTVDGQVWNGDSESRLHTNHAVVGVGYHFGS